MLETRAFRLQDVDRLPSQGQQAAEVAVVSRETLAAAARRGPAWTVVSDGDVVAVGGISVIYPGRALCWALVSGQATQGQRVAAARAALKMVRQARWLGVVRLEATVRADWPQAAGFLAGLGFQREGVLRRYGPDGADHEMWARIEPCRDDGSVFGTCDTGDEG